ncbi:MAG: hypothetical protein MPW15_10260 [Candidatus Manganitrophus sp.]|nr:hypothetical protein [Candidatus Manganitrophus sp.]
MSAFVTLETGNAPSDQLKEALRAHVVKEIGAIARPDDIRFTDNLPKTRSGKIMRRLLRDIAAGTRNPRRYDDPGRLYGPGQAAAGGGIKREFSSLIRREIRKKKRQSVRDY